MWAQHQAHVSHVTRSAIHLDARHIRSSIKLETLKSSTLAIQTAMALCGSRMGFVSCSGSGELEVSFVHGPLVHPAHIPKAS
jgi:hypothetical protein